MPQQRAAETDEAGSAPIRSTDWRAARAEHVRLRLEHRRSRAHAGQPLTLPSSPSCESLPAHAPRAEGATDRPARSSAARTEPLRLVFATWEANRQRDADRDPDDRERFLYEPGSQPNAVQVQNARAASSWRRVPPSLRARRREPDVGLDRR